MGSSADFDDSEVSDKFYKKKFAKNSSCSQDNEQTFASEFRLNSSERNYHGERFYGATVYAISINKAEY